MNSIMILSVLLLVRRGRKTQWHQSLLFYCRYDMTFKRWIYTEVSQIKYRLYIENINMVYCETFLICASLIRFCTILISDNLIASTSGPFFDWFMVFRLTMSECISIGHWFKYYWGWSHIKGTLNDLNVQKYHFDGLNFFTANFGWELAGNFPSANDIKSFWFCRPGIKNFMRQKWSEVRK